MKAIKSIALLAVCIAVSIVANAQSEQWKEYLDICKQFRTDIGLKAILGRENL